MYYRIKGFINKRIEERRKRIEEQIEERRMMELIRESGLFDAGWYLAKTRISLKPKRILCFITCDTAVLKDATRDRFFVAVGI